MEPENLIDYRIYEDEELKAEKVIFQAYLHAFFRYKAYIGQLYNSGQISEAKALARISAAWDKLKLIQTNLESQSNVHNYDAKSQFYLVNTILFYLYSDVEVGLWN